MGPAVSLGNSVDDNDRRPEPFDHAWGRPGPPGSATIGTLTFVCAWPGRGGRGIRASCVAVDAGATLGATNAAVTFLPDAPFYSEDCRPSAKEGRG
jgi:hypothetical protein